uniref:Uncharacterized protein n=1 Tax=Thermococcus sp. IRI33 TaxID=1197733 RepID=L0B8F0_9EURY|nr:hypothetical protein [Thermococcus sp. IRI33]AFZ84247.1 hypothetical protein i33-7 [Thermococcus sp. IRI33]
MYVVDEVLQVAKNLGINYEEVVSYEGFEGVLVVLIVPENVPSTKKKKLVRQFRKRSIKVTFLTRPQSELANLALDFLLHAVQAFPEEDPSFIDVQMALRDLEELYDRNVLDIDFYFDIYEGISELDLSQVAEALDVPEKRIKDIVYYFKGFLYQYGDIEDEEAEADYGELSHNEYLELFGEGKEG